MVPWWVGFLDLEPRRGSPPEASQPEEVEGKDSTNRRWSGLCDVTGGGPILGAFQLGEEESDFGLGDSCG